MSPPHNTTIVAVLNGWSASTRKTRTAHLVRDVIMDYPYHHPFKLKVWKSLLIKVRSRLMRRWIIKNAHPTNNLLCVGKSLGARNMARRVFKDLHVATMFKRTAFVSIDPCWPLRWNWRPNLNNLPLVLTTQFHLARNIQLVAPPEVQAGAYMMYSHSHQMWLHHDPPWLKNVTMDYALDGVDHGNIIEHPLVEEVITHAYLFVNGSALGYMGAWYDGETRI